MRARSYQEAIWLERCLSSWVLLIGIIFLMPWYTLGAGQAFSMLRDVSDRDEVWGLLFSLIGGTQLYLTCVPRLQPLRRLMLWVMALFMTAMGFSLVASNPQGLAWTWLLMAGWLYWLAYRRGTPQVRNGR